MLAVCNHAANMHLKSLLSSCWIFLILIFHIKLSRNKEYPATVQELHQNSSSEKPHALDMLEFTN